MASIDNDVGAIVMKFMAVAALGFLVWWLWPEDS